MDIMNNDNHDNHRGFLCINRVILSNRYSNDNGEGNFIKLYYALSGNSRETTNQSFN